jgi:hypothetical protein
MDIAIPGRHSRRLGPELEEQQMAEYQVAAVWWPDGWEPRSALDVPNCIGWVGGAAAAPQMSYEQALTAVRGLNRQNMDHPGATWHVVAEEGPTGAMQAVIHKEGGGRGDCSHCPAHDFPCAAAD